MLAKCQQNVDKMSNVKILWKLHCFVTFWTTQTQDLPVSLWSMENYLIYPVFSNDILELWKGGFRTRQSVQRTKRKTREVQRGMCMECALHVLMTSQRTKEGGTGIYKREFLGIMRELQLGKTLSLPEKMRKKHEFQIRLQRCGLLIWQGAEHWHVQ